MLESLRREVFDALLNDRFEIDFDGSPLEVRLIRVEGLRPPSEDHRGRAPWAMVFRAPPEVLYEQGTYPVSHPKLGEMPLFLVPIGPDEQGMRYEAVFN